MNDLIATEHPFTVAGMGAAPFRFVGFYAIPSPALAEKNPDGYNNALAAMPRGVGCGTCACCGMAITNNYIVRNSAGKLFAVGCDCIEKTGDAPLISRAEAQARANARAKRAVIAAEREALRRQAWEAGRAEREARAAADAQAQAERERINRERFGWILAVLSGPAGGFCESVANDIVRFGRLPSGRGLTILREIYAKATGGRCGSRAFEDACNQFDRMLAN